MKRVCAILGLIIIAVFVVLHEPLIAQAPERMSYQAVIRDNSNVLIKNQQIGMRITISDGDTPVYVETQVATTNDNGLVTLEIGGGQAVSGTFGEINWSGGNFFIKTETDTAGETIYTISGTSALLSVPYAFFAASGGTPGPAGPQGLQGANGDQGPAGIQGLQGEPGPAGLQGDPGLQGLQGDQGPAGNQGSQGPKGDPGVLLNGSAVGNTPYWNGTSWVVNSGNIFNNGGNIGIGTTSPSAKLEVQGSLLVNPSYGSIRLAIPGGNGWEWGTQGGGLNMQLRSVSDGSANNIRMSLNGSTGNIGIGTGNSAPKSKLQVNASYNVLEASSSAENYHLSLIRAANATGAGVGISFGISSGSDIGSSIYHIREGANSHGSLIFATRPSGGSITERMKITSTGRVGIGTDNPDQLLHVQNNEGSAFIKVRSGGKASESAGIDLVRDGGVRQWRIVNSGSSDGPLFLGDLLFQSQSQDITGQNLQTNFVFNHDYFYPFRDNQVTLGRSGRRWSVIHAATGTINTSDAREKSNIANIHYGLEEVMRLRPVSFTWNENPEWGTKLGLIAQEVEDVVREVVVHSEPESIYDEDGNLSSEGSDHYGIYYSDLIPVLIKAIQDQQAIIEALEDRIKTLEEDANYSAKNASQTF